MSHDVIKDRYGRLYYLPYELSRRGHRVAGICLSYYADDECVSWASDAPLTWSSFNAGAGGWRIPYYVFRVVQAVRRQRPALLIGGSDLLHVGLTRVIAQLTGTPYLIDLYDNLESFGLSRVPLMQAFYRWSLRGTIGVTTVSQALQKYIESRVTCPVTTIESTIAAGTFFPMDRNASRKTLQLPENGIFIGTAGALAKERGTDIFFEAFLQLVHDMPALHLVLAGPLQGNTIPSHPNILYLGQLSHAKIPAFINALNIAVVCMQDTAFGRYAFPQKLYEIIASKVPVVAANVGAMASMLSAYPEMLYQPDSVADMTRVLRIQIQHPAIPDIPPPTWTDQAKKMERFMTGGVNIVKK